MAVEPVVYGASDRPPRGDYSRAGADYTCAQNYAGYTAADHDTYRRLYERQAALLPGSGLRRVHRGAALAGRQGPHSAV
jgi:phenylalanine-4-hydroxylase